MTQHSQGDLWIFGYGSLIWDPGFAFAESAIARAPGWYRSFCMASIHYRGTAQSPGLVLALDQAEGAFCDGLAFRVNQGDEGSVLAYLRERELISYAYHERKIEVILADGRRAPALSYVINREGEQYRGGLDLAAQAAIIARAHGSRGPNRDYLEATVDHLQALGIADPDLERLRDLVRGHSLGPAP